MRVSLSHDLLRFICALWSFWVIEGCVPGWAQCFLLCVRDLCVSWCLWELCVSCSWSWCMPWLCRDSCTLAVWLMSCCRTFVNLQRLSQMCCIRLTFCKRPGNVLRDCPVPLFLTSISLVDATCVNLSRSALCSLALVYVCYGRDGIAAAE